MSATARTVLLAALLLVTGVIGGGPAVATTFVMADTAHLFARADVVVLGRVTAIRSVEDGPARTRATVAVEAVVKGPPTAELDIVEPGGGVAGRQRWIHGAPTFFVGERVLLFLVRNQQRELETLFLAMGKFSVVRSSSGVDITVRNLGDARVLTAKRRGVHAAPAVTTQPLGELLASLRALAGGAASPHPGGLAATTIDPGPRANFTFAGPPLTRWFLTGHDEPIDYYLSSDGDAVLGLNASAEAAAAALAVWSNIVCANLTLRDAGTADSAPFSECDGRNQLTFNDPFAEIADPTECTGVLAVGGVCGSNRAPELFNGASFYGITEGDVVINNGFGECPFWNATNLAELLTHEIGHTLGLAHSSNDPSELDRSLREATMYYTAHFDGRGAVLASDDLAAICALYPADRDASVAFRRFAIVTDITRPAPSDRLVVEGTMDLGRARFDALTDTFIFDLLAAGTSVYRLAVPGGQWMASASGTRFRYRGASGTGTTVITLAAGTPGSLRLSIQARGLDLAGADTDPVVISLAVGQAVVTETVGASRITRGGS